MRRFLPPRRGTYDAYASEPRSPHKQVTPWPDAQIARLAAAQHGQVTRAQLRELGVSCAAIDHSLNRSRILPMFRGVYAVGHAPLSPLAREMGAVLACGRQAFLSHRSAASTWELRPALPPRSDVEVTVVGRCAGRRAGIEVHRVRRVDSKDVRRHQAILISSPARTLMEIAPVLSERELERAFDQFTILRLGTLRDVIGVVERNPLHRGRVALARLAEQARATTLTRSEAEERLLTLVRRGHLPEPELNRRLLGYEVDFLWRTERLVVEVDGYTYHRTRGAFNGIGAGMRSCRRRALR